MYRVKYQDLHHAAEIIYCFMTRSGLTKPECTIWDKNGVPNTLVNTGAGFMGKDAFCRKLLTKDFLSVTCVAATDRQDRRRVVLSLVQDVEFMVLSFPSSDGNLNDDEIRLMQLLGI